ncbi:uncharacterized protein LOC131434418 [Malaya genurostris]|uniref:uncharacterized protein LOC131434418 n=1 Tax=Malaya genurostris TaxID=325434 RepID=UPI0026F3CF5A|nr:uncharacterized protein LOC131434418 [Malaya genurostris]XP_058457086.1 uncharacterized protein LOC131434418 [Malaya genurostris]XP_058457087.1 uncharacterized protein LOC131434418 [Malaya genurostris]
MSLRAIQKRDRNKLSSAQQKQNHFINKSRSFVGGSTGTVGSSSGSVSASATGSGHGNHHHQHQHHSSNHEKWRNSSTASIPSSAAIVGLLNHTKRSISCPSLPKRNTHHPSMVLRFTKSESDLENVVSPGGTTTNVASSDPVHSFSSNNLYLGAKSEVCLKTLAVKSTNQPPAPFRNSAAIVGNRPRMYESSRRQSDSSGTDLGRTDKYAGINHNVALRIPIIGYEVMEERARFTIFKLRIENSISHTCWLVLRRYTDFVRLHITLRTLFPHCNLVLPKKKWFGNNFNSGFIDNRIQGLQKFINTILDDDAMRTCPTVREFFCLDEPPTYSESMEESRIIFEAQEETIAHLKQQLQTKDELIAALHAKVASETNRNKVLTNVIRNSFENCPKCAKQLDNHLKEFSYK